MMTMTSKIDFIPVLNIFPQPIFPAIYMPSIFPPFIPYNYVNYVQPDNFPSFADPYDQNPPQADLLPPGLASAEDEYFYFHDFFFSKDDLDPGYYSGKLSTASAYENIMTIKQQSIELASHAISILGNIWNQQNPEYGWEEISIYKGMEIHPNEWKSLLIEVLQEQISPKPSEQMTKVIQKLLEPSNECSRFEKYCRKTALHEISEAIEDDDLLVELIKALDMESQPVEIPYIQQASKRLGNSLGFKKLDEKISQQESVVNVEGVKEEMTDLKIGSNYPLEATETKNIEKIEREEQIKSSIDGTRKKRKESRKTQETKENESNNILASEQISKQHKDRKKPDDQVRVFIQAHKKFQEDKEAKAYNLNSANDARYNDLSNQLAEAKVGAEDKLFEETSKKKKSKKNKKKRGARKNTQDNLKVDSTSSSNKEKFFTLTLDSFTPKLIKEENLAEKESQINSNLEKVDAVEKEFSMTRDSVSKNFMENPFMNQDEKYFSTRDFINEQLKDYYLLKGHNSTLTGETSAKTETDVSTEYEESKKEGSGRDARKIGKDKKLKLGQFHSDDYLYQNDGIPSPRSSSNIENEYYLDMISTILAEDPSALDKLKEMLLAHSMYVNIPGIGFTEEEIQEIEEVNLELEKVMKRRFKDTITEEENQIAVEEKPVVPANNEDQELIGLSNELMSLSALICDDFEEISLQKSQEIENNVLGIPLNTMSYLKEIMRSRAEFMAELQSGIKNT